VSVVTPPERIFVVPIDNRTTTIAADDRIYVVPDDE
jgi:hypothetical protein